MMGNLSATLAVDWLAGWKGGRAESLGQMCEDAVVVSSPLIPQALDRPGGELHGRDSFESYAGWLMENFPTDNFKLLSVSTSATSIEITYSAMQQLFAWERLWMGEAGKIMAIECHYQATAPSDGNSPNSSLISGTC